MTDFLPPHPEQRRFRPKVERSVGCSLGTEVVSATHQLEGRRTEIADTNTSLGSVPAARQPPAVRIGRRELAAIRSRLSARDEMVLTLVARHRFISTTHLAGLVEETGTLLPSHVVRRIVRRLSSLGLLRALARRIGGVRAGSSATIWQLAPAGARLLDEIHGSYYRSREPSERFLRHCLAVADVNVSLRSLAHGAAYELTVELEPDCWRTHLGMGGERRTLQPDLLVTLETSEFALSLFAEVDMGTESLRTLLSKCSQYETYRWSGTEHGKGGVFPFVWWVFVGDRADEREQRLRRAIHRSPEYLPEMYRFSTLSSFAADLRTELADE